MSAGRSGPSAGRGLEHTMLPEMLDHVIQTFFPSIWRPPTGNLREVGAHLACFAFMCTPASDLL